MINPEQSTGVGEENEADNRRTEMLDYLAMEGMKALSLSLRRFRTIAASHPEHTDLPAQLFSLSQLEAHLYAGLRQAGYRDDEIHRIQASTTPEPPHDPLIPRSNWS